MTLLPALSPSPAILLWASSSPDFFSPAAEQIRTAESRNRSPDDPPETFDRKMTRFLKLPASPAPLSEAFLAAYNAQAQTLRLLSIIRQVTGELLTHE